MLDTKVPGITLNIRKMTAAMARMIGTICRRRRRTKEIIQDSNLELATQDSRTSGLAVPLSLGPVAI
jgi:hypothetical protein